MLIVTNREDLTADYLIARLRDEGRAYYRLNSDDLAHTVVRASFGFDRTSCALMFGGAEVDLSSVSAVWYRRVIRPDAGPETPPTFRSFAQAELRHLFEGLVAVLDARWVNPYVSTELAERKLYQLDRARRVGLLTPPTLVSSNPEELAAFAAREGRVVCKPLSQGLVSDGADWYAIHTREVRAGELDPPRVERHFPTLLQRLIPKGADIRITVIGEDVFPVEVVGSGDMPIDWRAAGDQVSYRVCPIPAAVEQGCRALMNDLKLAYGAFDFVRTDDQQWYFLEVNPAGEWAWLEVALGLPMRASFVRLFYGG